MRPDFVSSCDPTGAVEPSCDPTGAVEPSCEPTGVAVPICDPTTCFCGEMETGIRKSEVHWLASLAPSVVNDEIPSQMPKKVRSNTQDLTRTQVPLHKNARCPNDF